MLVIDDLEPNIVLMRRLLAESGFDVRIALGADEGLAAVARDQIDVIVMDVRMPGRTGFDICRELKANPATRLVPVVLMTAASDVEDRLQAIEAGADDFVTKPLNREELTARLRSLARVKRFTDDLESAEHVILSLALTIEARDTYTDGHCQRLASYATTVGTVLDLGDDELRALQRGGFLHDVGKIGIPDAVLLKPGPLTRQEFEVMKAHPVIGERLCGELRSLARVRGIVRHHHERLDGSGYPDGLRGDDVPLLAQIISLVDVYDALTTDRPYRRALAPWDACAELRLEAERGHRRGDLVDTLIDLIEGGRLTTTDTAPGVAGA